ncbi:MAG: protein translocase subunit SecF [Acidobacteria bacterium]|jgi:preprotein translocase subunit SecF|nr:protein translocase subunit SecF [Acidobacteriota bacterium]
MKIFNEVPNFKFMSIRKWGFTFSALIIIFGIILFFVKGFNMGLDFTGGTLVEISFKDNTSVEDVRKAMQEVGMGKSTIQKVGNDNKFFIRTEQVFETAAEEKTTDQKNKDDQHKGLINLIKDALLTAEEKRLSTTKLNLNDASEMRMTAFLVSKGVETEIAAESAKKIIDLITNNPKGLISDYSEIEKLDLKNQALRVIKENTFLGRFAFLGSNSIGPQVGKDLRGQATRAAVYALLGMLVYIAFRFKWIYGVSAILTLIHDTSLVLTFILLFNIEINLTVIAAILTLIGYSINDTIVIFDRIRDNVKVMRTKNAEMLMDVSINQTLSRTVITGGTTLFSLIALMIWGGEVLYPFAFTLFVGIIIGTYSSIYQSCAWLMVWEKKFIGGKKS